MEAIPDLGWQRPARHRCQHRIEERLFFLELRLERQGAWEQPGPPLARRRLLHRDSLRRRSSEYRALAYKRMSFRGSPSAIWNLARRSISSLTSGLGSVGMRTRKWTKRSPGVRPFIATPFPRRRTTLPLWVRSGTLRVTDPSMVGTLTLAPR